MSVPRIERFGRKHIKKYIKFALVGTVGVIVNGIVYSTLSRFDTFNLSPLGLGEYLNFFKNITWAWGCGILAAFTFNYFMNYYWTFRGSENDKHNNPNKE